MNLPSRSVSPLRTMRPSLTAITGAPRRAKILIPLRSCSDSTTSAAFWPALAFLPFCSTCPAYLARAWTGKRPWVSPVSEPTKFEGRPPISRARMSTESTYQSAWL